MSNSNSDFSSSSEDEQDYNTVRRGRRSLTPPRRRKSGKVECSFYEILKPFVVTVILFYFWNKLNNSAKDNFNYCD
jgi:hypothetical protein